MATLDHYDCEIASIELASRVEGDSTSPLALLHPVVVRSRLRTSNFSVGLVYCRSGDRIARHRRCQLGNKSPTGEEFGEIQSISVLLCSICLPFSFLTPCVGIHIFGICRVFVKRPLYIDVMSDHGLLPSWATRLQDELKPYGVTRWLNVGFGLKKRLR